VKLQDKVVVVTGSTRGIGRAIAEACAREGAKVVVSSRRESAVEEVAQAFRAQGWEASGLKADVSIPGDLERLLQHTVKTWGRVDVWVNNAGLSAGLRPLDELGAEELNCIVDVNLTGTLQACRIVIPFLIRHGGGIVVNMSGKGGRGEASPFMTAYAATKAAVTNLTKCLALEYKDHPISIHALIPGMVATDFYQDLQVSPGLEAMAHNTPYALEAFGVSLEEVGRGFVKIATQEPGKVTGKTYSLIGGWRLVRGVLLMMWYRLTGKLRATG
jgi:glucose 1-dehydrogenase